jgi:hypothetical protein
MKLNMISKPVIAAANAQPVGHQLSARTFRSGRAAAEHFGAGSVVLPRPRSAQGGSGPAAGFAAQLSTAPTSGSCASKQYQQMVPAFATDGGEVGPHPPREPV